MILKLVTEANLAELEPICSIDLSDEETAQKQLEALNKLIEEAKKDGI